MKRMYRARALIIARYLAYRKLRKQLQQNNKELFEALMELQAKHI